jgi:hypothetical protein
MRRLIIAAAGLGLIVLDRRCAVNAGGPPAVGFYVDGTLYRTVGTPTDFTGTGAPSFTYDKIYALGNGLRNVAEAKPGDRDFNGGRWAVYPVTWHIVPVQYTSDAQLLRRRTPATSRSPPLRSPLLLQRRADPAGPALIDVPTSPGPTGCRRTGHPHARPASDHAEGTRPAGTTFWTSQAWPRLDSAGGPRGPKRSSNSSSSCARAARRGS